MNPKHHLRCWHHCVVFLCLAWPAWAVSLNEEITTPHHSYKIHYYNRDSTNNAFTSDANAQKIAGHFDPDSGSGIHSLHAAQGFPAPTLNVRDVQLKDDAGTPRTSTQRMLIPVQLLNQWGYGSLTAQSVLAHECHHAHQYQFINPDSAYAKSSFSPIGFEGPAMAMMDCLFPGTDQWLDSNNYNWVFLAWTQQYLDTDENDPIYTSHQQDIWFSGGYETAFFGVISWINGGPTVPNLVWARTSSCASTRSPRPTTKASAQHSAMCYPNVTALPQAPQIAG